MVYPFLSPRIFLLNRIKSQNPLLSPRIFKILKNQISVISVISLILSQTKSAASLAGKYPQFSNSRLRVFFVGR